MKNLKLYEDTERIMLDDLINLGFMHKYRVWIELEIYVPKEGAKIPHADPYVMIPVDLEVIVSSKDSLDIQKAALKKMEKKDYEQDLNSSVLQRFPDLKTALDKKGLILNHPGSYNDMMKMKDDLEKETTMNSTYPTEGDVLIQEIK